MRSLAISVLIFFGLTAMAAIGGGIMSLFTGKVGDLPQWNGWPYLIFCAKEGVIFGAMITVPIAILAFVVLSIRSRK